MITVGGTFKLIPPLNRNQTPLCEWLRRNLGTHSTRVKSTCVAERNQRLRTFPAKFNWASNGVTALQMPTLFELLAIVIIAQKCFVFDLKNSNDCRVFLLQLSMPTYFTTI